MTLVLEIQKRVRDQYQRSQSLLQSDTLAHDPEIVHQYRVSLRRARSLLILFADHLSSAACVQASLAAQASWANALRDWDVFLAELPEGAVKHYAQVRRDEAFHRFLKLVSEHQRERALCTRVMELPWPETVTSFRQGVLQAQAAVASRVVARCERAMARDKSGDWHRLRLAIKRQRYLYNLCVEGKAPQWVKPWQELLGNFNDLCCQIEILKDCCREKGGVGREAKVLRKQWKARRKTLRQEMRILAERQLMKNGTNTSRWAENH